MRTTNRLASFATPFAGLAVAFTLAVAPADAGVIVDTGQPVGMNPGYSILPPGAIFGPDFPGQAIAGRFTVDVAYTITDIEGVVARFGGGDAVTYHIALYEDGPGPNHWVPGAELFNVALSTSGFGTSLIGANGLDWKIGPGSYWVGFEARAGDTLNGYMPYFAPNPLRQALGPVGAYRPALGAPSGTILIQGFVPEPQAWALMLLGFGAAGAMLRAHRRMAIA